MGKKVDQVSRVMLASITKDGRRSIEWIFNSAVCLGNFVTALLVTIHVTRGTKVL